MIELTKTVLAENKQTKVWPHETSIMVCIIIVKAYSMAEGI